MKVAIIIIFSLATVYCPAQSDVEVLTATLKNFHQALVKKDIGLINQLTDPALSYGHSNGWVETKADIIKDLETNFISYQSFKEDSVSVSLSGTMANVRFLADVSAVLKGTASNFRLKVLEVWAKGDNGWVLFGRQAVKFQ